MAGQYILDGHVARPAPDLLTWARWFETAGRIVGRDKVAEDVEVSTVFLGLDHQSGVGPPLLFETLVLGGPLDGEQWRYSTWTEAEEGHAKMVKLVSGGA